MRFRISLLIAALGFFAALPVRAQPTDAPGSASPAIPCRLGVYLQSLSGDDVGGGTFGASAWVWVNCPSTGTPVLSKLDYPNAEDLELRFPDSLRAGAGTYENVLVRGTFRHDWNVRNYPFDRHTLHLDFEHTLLDTTQLVLLPDTAESGLADGLGLDGWNIRGMRLTSRPVTYATTFGLPGAAEQATFSRVTIAVDIERNSLLTFLKLTAGLYFAIATALLTFWMGSEPGDILGSRISLLVGALFAAFVNFSAADSALGASNQLTLVDVLHFIGLAAIVAAMILAVRAYGLALKGDADALRRSDRRQFWALTLGLLLANGVVIALAALGG